MLHGINGVNSRDSRGIFPASSAPTETGNLIKFAGQLLKGGDRWSAEGQRNKCPGAGDTNGRLGLERVCWDHEQGTRPLVNRFW